MNQQAESSVIIAQPSLGIEVLSQVLRALYAAGKPSTYKDLASSADLHPANVSQSLTALRDLGLCDSASRGVYRISHAGAGFVRYQTTGKLEDSRRVLREAIMNSQQWSEVVAFLRANQGKPRSPVDLALNVEMKTGKQWSQSMRSRVASAYLSILTYAEVVSAEDGAMVSRTELIQDEKRENLQEPMTGQEEPESDYERLQVSQFSVAVRRQPSSVAFLLGMTKEGSMVYAWLKQILAELGASEDGS